MPRADFPARFRRRLTVIFVLVASSASGTLAVSSYTAVRASRERSFVDRAESQALTTAALLGRDIEPGDIEERLAAFGETLTADVVAVHYGASFVSTPYLARESIPAELADAEDLDRNAAETRVGTTKYRVVGLTAARSGTRLYFFFSRQPLEEGLRELARILAIAWTVVTALAAGVGTLVARRTLRPVGTAAAAAQAIAEGVLDTRLPVSGADEFATLARAFNEMAQALQEKLDELSTAHERERRFTGDVAHELMTPVGALVAEASVLDSHLDEMPPTARRMTELVIHDARRLRSLVEELLELARLDAATAVDASEPVRIGDVVESAVAATGRRTEIEVAGDVDAMIVTNRACVDRIVSNLVRNAIRHGGGRDVTVSVDAVPQETVIAVRDHGPGIDPEHLPHLFDRFFKADTARSGGGAGLGLAIASEYARLLGSRLEAANAPDGGAVFTLRLHAVEPTAPPALPA